MAAPCLRTVGSLLRKYGACSSTARQMILHRRLSVSSALLVKNLAALGPEKFSKEYVEKQKEEFNIGKRHLANIMGEDPENFTQEDIDRSIAYLFPSGLFDKKARPLMKPPEEFFPQERAVQWDTNGRPLHFLFYTGKQSYFSLMHEIYGKIMDVEKHQDLLIAKGLFSSKVKDMPPGAWMWITKEELESLLVESISTHDYNVFIKTLERLQSMPYSSTEEKFILKYRKKLEILSRDQDIAPLESDDRGVAFSTANGKRKTSTSTVVLRDCGSGRVLVNGQNCLQYFSVLQDREQIMFPLQFTGMLGRFDLECTVTGGGRSSQAGAVRLAISRALLGFLSKAEMENMRQAGLLTPDPRVRERKKPGQEGARKKFTWNKR